MVRRTLFAALPRGLSLSPRSPHSRPRLRPQIPRVLPLSKQGAAAPSGGRSGWRGIPTTTPARSPSAISATSGPPTKTAPASQRLTDNSAREVYPRFSPDGNWIAFSSNRYGNNDVFVVAGGRRHAEAADVPHRQRRRRRLDARLAAGASSAPRAATARSRASRRCTRSPSTADRRSRCRSTGATAGSYSPDGKSLVFNRHPSTWSRQHYRGSYAADLWIAEPRRQDLHAAARRRALQPLLADVGRRRRDLLRRRSAAERQEREARQPRGAQERQQHLQDPARGGGQPVQVTQAHRRAACSGRRCRATARSSSTKTTSASGSSTSPAGARSEIKLDIATDEKENEIEFETVTQRSRRVRHLAVGPARRDLGARADPDDRDRPRRHHARRARHDGVAQRPAEVVARRQVHRVRLGSIRPRRGLDLRSGRARRRRRSPISTTRRARSSGRRIRRRCSTRPPTRSSTATASPTARPRSSRRATSAGSDRWRSRPTASGSRSRSRTARCDRTSTSRRSPAAKSGTSPTTACIYSENNAVWTADGRYIVFTSTEGASNGIASQGGISDDDDAVGDCRCAIRIAIR